MGNIDSLRDWGHAKDYVEMQWLMLQQDKPDDYVIATGEQYSVRDFIRWSADEIGITLSFEGEGVEEVGVVTKVDKTLSPKVEVGETIIKVDPKYFRPTEVETLLGDADKARRELGWEPKISVKEMCSEMMKNDIEEAKKSSLLDQHGFKTNMAVED